MDKKQTKGNAGTKTIKSGATQVIVQKKQGKKEPKDHKEKQKNESTQ
jgi:hypothetical protein